MNYRIGSRLFHEIPSDNNSKELIADDGGDMTNAEWEAFCKLKVSDLRRIAKERHEASKAKALAYMATVRPNTF
jgi:hypothetical protein